MDAVTDTYLNSEEWVKDHYHHSDEWVEDHYNQSIHLIKVWNDQVQTMLNNYTQNGQDITNNTLADLNTALQKLKDDRQHDLQGLVEEKILFGSKINEMSIQSMKIAPISYVFSQFIFKIFNVKVRDLNHHAHQDAHSTSTTL